MNFLIIQVKGSWSSLCSYHFSKNQPTMIKEVRPTNRHCMKCSILGSVNND